MSETSSNLILPFLQSGQAQKHVTVNESLLRLDALVQLAAVSANTAAQPGSPSDGQVYILPSGKSGADWGAMENGALAHYRDGVWEEIAPREGFLAFVRDVNALVFFDGSAWRSIARSIARAAGVCDGRLTLESGVAVSTSDQAAKTIVYFTPYKGNQIALYDGVSAWALTAFGEISIKLTDTQTGVTANGATSVTGLSDTSQLFVGMEVSGTGIAGGATIAAIPSSTAVTLSANATATGSASLTFKVPADTNLDVFAYAASGVLKLEMVKWSNATVRATAVVQQDGVHMKSSATTRRLLGTVRTSATAGQTEMKFGGGASGGAPASLLVDNAQNKVPVTARVLETDASWNYGTNTVRPYNNSSGNRISFVRCLPDDRVEAAFNAGAYNNAATRIATGGIGLDTTSAISSSRFFVYSSSGAIQTGCCVTYRPGPLVGFHYLQAVERADAGATVTFYGQYSGGIDSALEATLFA